MARTKRASIHYVNNKDFSQAVVDYVRAVNEAKAKEKWMEAGEEALIGGVLTAPFGVGSTVAEKLAAHESNKFNKMFQATDDNGNLVFEQDGVTPVYDYENVNWEEFRGEPGFINKAYSMALGGPTAKILASHVGQSSKVADLVAEFGQQAGDWGRVKGIETVGARTNLNKGVMYEAATPFLSLKKKDAAKVHDAIVRKTHLYWKVTRN